MDEKVTLPPYSAIADTPLGSSSSPPTVRAQQTYRTRRGYRRSRTVRILALAGLVIFILVQWRQLWHTEVRAPHLSTQKLSVDLDTCQKLRQKPKDPAGPGRDANARYVNGGRPTLIRNATIWTGEPVEGSSEDDIRSGAAWVWQQADVFLRRGLIQRVELEIPQDTLPDDTIIFNAHGRQLTSGIIDMHSHAGVNSLPALNGNADFNEGSDNLTPWARSIDGIFPLDPQIQVIKSGGVTTSLVLPGSANSVGGEAYLMKHAVGSKDGRPETSAADMLADPEHNWRYLKMACGENPKNFHGSRTTRPSTRMGEAYELRSALTRAQQLNQRQDDWCNKAEALGLESMENYLPRDLEWDTLGAVLRGQVHVNVHCYTVPDLEAMVRHTNEFEFPIRSFHHAHQTYLVPEILNRTWGGRTPSSALFADNMYYKVEAYIGSPHAGKYIYDEGLTPVYVSDNPVLNAQHVVFEAAKGYHYGLPYHAALAAVTTAPADDLGMGNRIGKVKHGFDADVVVWDSDPLSVGAAPVQVWIDGSAQYENPVVLSKNSTGPIVPDQKLTNIVEQPRELADVLFSGVSKILLEGHGVSASETDMLNVAISGGNITCIGICAEEFKAASAAGVETIHLHNGYLHPSYVGVAGTLGLNEIDAEPMTDNGPNPIKFTRALDGLLLDSKKLHAAFNSGVTRAISSPTFTGGGSHHGTSVGFVTDAKNSLEQGSVFADDVALHYTLGLSVRSMDSYSGAFGDLRTLLLQTGEVDHEVLPWSELAFLKRVSEDGMTLALTINSADGIASALRIKADMKAVNPDSDLKIAIIGGAEAHLLADELAAANVGVILTPLQSKAEMWDERRALSGAPLTNGTNIDRLLDAGVKVGIGLREDWEVRDLAFSAGIAYRNGEGRLTEKGALDLIGKNVYEILGVKVPSELESGHFVVSEGSPLEIGSRLRAVGSGRGKVSLFV